jgi:hypothetical protein
VRAELPPIFALLAATVILFRDGILRGLVFFEFDTERFYYPMTRWFADHWRNGHLPLWLPDIFSGYPITADGETGVLYPPNLLALRVLDAGHALLWLRVLHYGLAAVSMYALLRVLGAGRAGALVGGLTFTYSGYLVTQVQHENVVRTAVWLPLILCLTELALRRVSWAYHRYLIAAGLALGLALLGLHVQPALMTGAAVGLYILIRSAACRPAGAPHPVLRATWSLLVIYGLGASVAAVQLLPLLEQARASFRAGGVSYEFASALSVAPVNLPSLIFPYFFRLGESTWWTLWHPWETLFYVGVVALLLAPLGLLRAPRSIGLYFGVLAVTSLLIAMSHYGPVNLHEVLWRLPGMSFLRAPGRFSYLFTFAMAGLAAFGADWVACSARRPRTLLALAVVPLALLGGCIWVLTSLRSWLLDDPAAARVYLDGTYIALRHQSETLNADTVYSGLVWSTDLLNHKTTFSLALLAACAVLLVVFALRSARLPISLPRQLGHGLPLLLPFVVAWDVLAFAYSLHPQIDLRQLGQPNPVALAAQEAGGRRMMAAPEVPLLEPNLPMVAGARDASGYSSLPSQRHFDFWSRVRHSPDTLLDLWGVDIWVAPPDEWDAIREGQYMFFPRRPLLEGPAVNRVGSESFRVPNVAGAQVHVIGWLTHAVEVADGALVAEVTVEGEDGSVQHLELRAGQHLAERAYDRVDVRPMVRHAKPPVLRTGQEWHLDGTQFPVHYYLARVPLERATRVARLQVTAVLPRGELVVFGVSVADQQGVPVFSVRPNDRERFEVIRDVEGTIVYRNTRAWPRAFVVHRAVTLEPGRRDSPLIQMLSSPFNPASEVLLERYDGAARPLNQPSQAATQPRAPLPARVEDLNTEHVRVHASLSEPGFVVLSDLYHRGWEARVDGAAAPLYLADTLFRAVPVPAGEHVVDFIFDPISFRLGAFITLAGLLFASLVAAGSLWWERRARRLG